MSEPMKTNSDEPDLWLGTMDAIYAMGVALSNAGILQRKDLADIYGRTLAQMEVMAVHGDFGPHPEARYSAVRCLAEAFSVPVRTGLMAIEGGKVSPS